MVVGALVDLLHHLLKGLVDVGPIYGRSEEVESLMLLGVSLKEFLIDLMLFLHQVDLIQEKGDHHVG